MDEPNDDLDDLFSDLIPEICRLDPAKLRRFEELLPGDGDIGPPQTPHEELLDRVHFFQLDLRSIYSDRPSSTALQPSAPPFN